MIYDNIIENGTLIDPYMGVHEEKDIYVYQDTIMPTPDSLKMK